MSINIFDYWSFDPNGFIRHLLVGAVLSMLLLKLNYRFVAAIIFSVAYWKGVFRPFGFWKILFVCRCSLYGCALSLLHFSK
jgi:hypothetical protein